MASEPKSSSLRLWGSNMRLKFFLTLMSVILLAPSASWAAEVWAAAGFENSPANSDAASLGAGKIRATREEVRQRADVEHFWGTTDDTSDDNGLHRLGSARCFVSDSAPTTLSNTMADYDNTGGGDDETDLDNAATNSANEMSAVAGCSAPGSYSRRYTQANRSA